MKKNFPSRTEILHPSGFTLIELLIYAAIFSVSAVFLVGILTTVTQTQLKQASNNEVGQQVSFVAETIQRLIRQSSAIENDAGVSSTTLVLRMGSSSLDKTLIYSDASNTAIYVQQGTSTPVSLTNEKVTVGNFSIVKVENPGGPAIAQVDLTLTSVAQGTQAPISQSWRSAVTRVSAASFDSSVWPSGSGQSIGLSANPWQNGFFSSFVTIGTTTQHSMLGVAGGDIATTDAGKGIVVRTPDGSGCYRISVSNSGTVTSTVVSCP